MQRVFAGDQYKTGKGDGVEMLMEAMNGGGMRIMRKGGGGMKSKKSQKKEQGATPSSTAEEDEDEAVEEEGTKTTSVLEFTAHLCLMGGTHPDTGRNWMSREERSTDGKMARFLQSWVESEPQELPNREASMEMVKQLKEGPQLHVLLCIINLYCRHIRDVNTDEPFGGLTAPPSPLPPPTLHQHQSQIYSIIMSVVCL